jgi:phosphatidylinositol glycan class O
MQTMSRSIILLRLLLPPTLIALGLTIFTQSFFLSRTSFDHRSSCEPAAAGSLLKDALGMNDGEIKFLRENGWLSDYLRHNDHHNVTARNNNGCWVPRKVESMAIIVVDALRFDFARDHLPLSVGSRLFPENNGQSNKTSRGFSKLYQFVADPPTVTMQRLKGLTTGGLPTFADITGSFGGASIEEDSWVEQLKNSPWEQRMMHNYNNKPQIAFVGDDTWIDLFPTQFDDAHPYPSFNTRDLDTVDNGCMLHLPRILDRIAGLKPNNDPTTMKLPPFELMVAHFLGVDHVGHTYGPNNPHMVKKLQQMDNMLSNTLDRIDNAPEKSCIIALVLGDHGMTEDGNHGGGTSEEVNAGLFVHFSPGCNAREGYDQRIDGREIGSESTQAFDSIHQIDLVPTISLLLGLPIPYANIGGLVTAILPTPSASSSTPYIATALALNAAQVWTYLHTYSQTSRDLPQGRLLELKEILDSAAIFYRGAILQSQKEKENGMLQDNSYHDSTEFRQACGLFKIFLAESTGLGKQVWTQFNENGMMIGICILFLAWILANPLWKRDVRKHMGMIFCWFGTKNKFDDVRSTGASKSSVNDAVNGSSEDQFARSLQSFHLLEVAASIICMIFYSGVLTFGNSYIEHEREIVTFFLAILCLLVFRRWYYVSNNNATTSAASAYLPLLVILCSRMYDVFVTGHGLDPSIRLHPSHNALVFMPALAMLLALRLRWFETSQSFSVSKLIDVLTIVCLACSWWEKRTHDHSRNGHEFARASMLFVIIGMMHSAYGTGSELTSQFNDNRVRRSWKLLSHSRLILFRVMMFLVIVTGPSTASTAVMVLVQCAALSQMMMQSKVHTEIDAPVMAAIWRLLIRHIFFATNHHCSFNRLHFTAAFVATDTFQFHIAGFSLFMNTFGWELLGTTLLLLTSRFTTSFTTADSKNGPSRVWDWFCFYQCTETLTSCISVSAMKRHCEYPYQLSETFYLVLSKISQDNVSFAFSSDGMGNICSQVYVYCNIYWFGVDVLVH